MNIEEIIAYHIKRYPKIQLQDIFKLLFQNEFGGEHLIANEEEFEKYLAQELEQIQTDNKLVGQEELLEDIGNQTFRIQLYKAKEKLSAKTLAKLCITSSKKNKGNNKSLLEKLQIIENMAMQQKISFSSEEVRRQIEKYVQEGFPTLHHSEQYKKVYNPHYRLLSAESALYLPVFIAIEAQLKNKRNILVAIDGMAASGKTSFANMLQQVYACEVLHADDFFLQAHQRTPQRLDEVGGNVDYERMREVVASLRQNKKTYYQPYNCMTQKLEEPVLILPEKLVIVEGSYAMHRTMINNYDVKVYMSCSKEIQKQRILERNGEEMLTRFTGEWIPKENAYATSEKIKEKSDFVIDTSVL